MRLQRFNRRSISAYLGLSLLTVLSAGCSDGENNGANNTSLHIKNPDTVIESTQKINSLIIDEGASLVAPEGSQLTLSVDGVGTPIVPGTYEGNVVLTPTQNYTVDFNLYGPYQFRSAITINNNKVVPEQTITAMANGGTIGDQFATDVNINSLEEKFNGLVVTGDSNYTINNLTIDFTGNGGNDFAGFGAAVMTTDNATLTINGANIRTKGAIRPALFAGGTSTLIVKDADIETESGTLPDNYQFSIAPGEMMEVPYGLGLTGNVRATNIVDQATVYYIDSKFKSHGWGVLSSDGNGPTRMFVWNSVIETEGSGYGAYSNGDAHDYFSHTTFDVDDVGLIVGGNGWATFTDGTVVNSKKLGVMLHQGTGGSVITLNKKSEINSANTAIQIKGRGADIFIEDASLNPGNGILVQSMANDDPIIKGIADGTLTMPPPPIAEGEEPPPLMPGSESGGFSPDVNVNIKDATLKGDIAHAMTDIGAMSVVLQNTKLDGVISTSETKPASGAEPSRETFKTIGEVVNHYKPITSDKGLDVYLDGSSTWTLTGPAYLNGLTLAEGALIKAPPEKQVVMSINGNKTAIKAGSFSGMITLEIK